MPTTIANIKENMQNKLGSQIEIIAQTGRKRQSKRKGVLSEVYPSVFVVDLDQDENSFERVSYSYSDILTKSVEVCFLEEAV
ncbi:Uncharacterized protein Veg [Pilibacter termitis]|uniref:Uncharacterized protein Veg n=1 Tax=Pilibacter termitis TaxID=263852 RepID=A0A1T4PN46_9ENTE|nr:Veg family protein [Pilibacter termitis]SJZ92637.1 Uncharacterized protein Veg [Pilibacter termitis]